MNSINDINPSQVKHSSPQMLCEACYKENCWYQKLINWFKNKLN